VDAYSVVGGKTELSTAFADKNKNLSGQYVLLEGQFDAKSNGHMGMFSGTITKITRADPWPSRADMVKRQ
jgi:hypothetical protein